MAIGVNSVLSMGVGALFASQANIQTTGNNISNVNTPGYSRQAVILQEQYSLNYTPGQVGQGVKATEIIRYFDSFVEKNYVDKLSTASRHQTNLSFLRSAENIFNESNDMGVSAVLTEMFKSWNTLSQEPDSLPAREALLAKAKALAGTIRTASNDLESLQRQADTMIKQDIDTANRLIEEIADISKEISMNYIEGRNNPNALMDARDAKVRELSTIVDVSIMDRGPRNYSITTASGNLLVQEGIPYKFEFQGPSVENNLKAGSPYIGTTPTGAQRTAHFNGFDTHEYTVEMVTGGAIGSGAQFRVSIDNGRTWLTDDNGATKIFDANTEGNSVLAGGLEIYFDAGNINAGDKFVISPKSDVYWISPTSGPLNVSTQMYPDGSENTLRLTGGSIAGYLEFRDYRVGEYRERLDAFSETLIWEINRLHSQGAGLTPMNHALGTQQVERPGVALGSPQALFPWSDKLESGNVTFAIYDRTTGKSVIPYPGIEVFSPTNFDPSQHSLEDVRDAINASPGGYLKATIVDKRLEITTNDPNHSFGITSDTTGLAAALGINTFFTGTNAETMAVRDEISSNINLLNAGRINGAGEINKGDNITAKEIAALISKKVDISSTWKATINQTMVEYYAGLVTRVGADTSNVKYSAATETAVARDLYDRQEELSGVNLDEEMSNLIKFQASYKAAAKLITTADEMLQTLLSLKQ